MDVFLVPVGRRRFELYAEAPEERPDVGDVSSRGFWRDLQARFRAVLDEVERNRASHDAAVASSRPPTRTARLRVSVLRWIAERIAEQRLLWHLRTLPSARLWHPDTLSEEAASRTLRSNLKRDRDRHLVWLVFNGTLFVLSGALMFVPGPNLIAYYFAFRLVGHYLSMRGARHGLSTTVWACQASAPLTRLGQALAVPRPKRDELVSAIARELALKRLAWFYNRTAVGL